MKIRIFGVDLARCRFCCAILFFAVFLLVPALQAYPSLVKNGEYLVERVQSSDSSRFVRSKLQTLGRSGPVELVEDVLSAAASSTPQGAVIEFTPAQDHCAEIMRRDSSVIACTPNFVKYILRDSDYALASASWPLRAESGPDMQLARAWELERGEAQTVIAVLDTGVDYNHPDLRQQIWQNPWEIADNGIDDDLNGYIDDLHGISVDSKDPDPIDRIGHGTHVAGIIAARSRYDLSTSGVAPGVTILPVRFIDENLGTIFDLVKGMNYILELKQRGVNIVAINASYGAIDFAYPEYHAIKRARELGILLVAAAGNESVNNDEVPSYPANYPLDNIISVASVGGHGALSQFSNYGVKTVQLAAPGENILSTVPHGEYAAFDGTSAAAPFVSAAVGLLHSYQPGLSYLQMRSRIIEFASPLSSLSGLIEGGRFLNLYAPLSLERPEPIDLTSSSATGLTAKFNLYSGDIQSGRRAVPVGKGVLIVLERAAGENAFSPVNIELSVGAKTCPNPFRTSVGADLAVLTTTLPSAWRNLRVIFSARNGAGAITGKDYIRFVEIGRKNTAQRSRLRRAPARAMLKRVCREFTRNTRIA